jgi:thiol-disulfide isomerase/thioredoxin
MLTPFLVPFFLGTCLAQDPAPKPPPPPPPAEKVLSLGEQLPKGLTFRNIEGAVQALDELRGKVVVVHFWSMTCPWEVVAEPKINTLSAELADKGVVVLGVAANANEIGAAPAPAEFDVKDADQKPYAKMRAKAREVKCNHAILVDHEAALGRLLDAKTTPHCFVFDKEGKLQYQGALDDDGRGQKETPTQFVRDAVTALLAGDKPGVQTTKPYG